MDKDIDKIKKEIFNPEEENHRKLEQLFPGVIKDGTLDVSALMDELGEYEVVDTEKYELTWAGKSKAKQIANTDIVSRTLKYIPEDSKNPDTTENLYIEGDNLEVLKLLRNSYYGQIKMIYIDPPYNTGNDFVYKDNFSISKEQSDKEEGETDEEGNRFIVNQKSSNRYHANWLNMMYPRLKVAKDLLRDDGVIFISIDDIEIANLRKLCDEIFGDENFISIFPWRKRTAKSDVPFGVSQDFEWILCISKGNFLAGLEFERKYYQTNDYPNDRWRLSDLTTQKIEADRPNSAFDLVDPKTKKIYKYNPRRLWGITKETFQTYYDKGKIVFPDDYDFLNTSIPSYRVFESEDKAKALEKYGSENSIKSVSTFLPKEVGMTENGNKEIIDLFKKNVFPFPKPSTLLYHFIKMSKIQPSDIILDFFSGSATSAHAIMQLNAEDGGNRKFIMVQLPEICEEKSEAYKAGYKNICEIGKERIRRAGEKIKKELTDKQDGTLQLEGESIDPEKLDIGFRVFRVGDTNIRWNKENFDMKRTLEESAYSDKDLLDFMAGFKDIDIVYEIMLRHRDIPLSSKVEVLKFIGSRTYIFADTVVVCLEEKITNAMIDKISAIDPKPQKIIFRDSAFDDDISLKHNTLTRFDNQLKKNNQTKDQTYRVEFI